jgi:hypothetical protein
MTIPSTTINPPATVNPEVTVVDSGMIPVPVAQQIFSLVPAVAAGLAGMVLAYRLTNARAISVKTSEVAMATAISFAASFAAVFVMKTFQTYDAEE